jgi:hypothetical protein
MEVSLESYHPYLQPQEVSKGPTTLDTYGSLSKNGKGCFGFLSPLGVKLKHYCRNSNFYTATPNDKLIVPLASKDSKYFNFGFICKILKTHFICVSNFFQGLQSLLMVILRDLKT